MPYDRPTRDPLTLLAELERRLARTERALAEAQAQIAILNDRLAWTEADLAGLAAPSEPARPRPHREH